MNDKQLIIGAFGLLAVAFIFAFVMVGVVIGADGSFQPDPIFKNSKDSNKRNFIIRDKDGRRIGYAINDPIFPGDNWILFGSSGAKVGNLIPDPIFPKDNFLLFDLDPVGE